VVKEESVSKQWNLGEPKVAVCLFRAHLSIQMTQTAKQVPFLRPELGVEEENEVIAVLRSGWLTTGPRVQRFEQEFAAAVGANYAVAVNSCTAALHLAVEALGLKQGQAVLVPSMTFAATAEVVRYLGAIPILVDCDPATANLDLSDAESKIKQLRSGLLLSPIECDIEIVGILPVHVGGLMGDIDEISNFARALGLWVVEDAAHAFPAAWRRSAADPWQRCGEATANVTCFSFYANKTITTGEGGMAVTDDPELAARIRLMSLHGLSHDAWGRYTGAGSWDYKIIAPGYKYNLTDIAAAIGIHQLARAEEMRLKREGIAYQYMTALSEIDEIELPPTDINRLHAWHLFPIKLHLNNLTIDRNMFIQHLKNAGTGCSVHWRPLHLHPYYQNLFRWRSSDLPASSMLWERVVSLPIFSSMNEEEIEHVINSVKAICARFSSRDQRSGAYKSGGMARSAATLDKESFERASAE
jgi:dTDP-4-amino-4,6-dideoxygalactose transaminase